MTHGPHIKWVFDADEWAFVIREAHSFIGDEFPDIIGESPDMIRSWELMRHWHRFYMLPKIGQIIKVCHVLGLDPRIFMITRYIP